jgi:hypothetical protein
MDLTDRMLLVSGTSADIALAVSILLSQLGTALGSELLWHVEELHSLRFADPREVANMKELPPIDTSRWVTGSTVVMESRSIAQ